MTDPQTDELFFSLMFKDRNVVENTQERFRLAGKSATLRGFMAAGYARIGLLLGRNALKAKPAKKGAKAPSKGASRSARPTSSKSAKVSSIPFEQRAAQAREILRAIADAKEDLSRVQDEQRLRAVASEALVRAALVHTPDPAERAQATEAIAALLREYGAGASDRRKAAILQTVASVNGELSKLPQIPVRADPHALMVAPGDLIQLVRAHVNAAR